MFMTTIMKLYVLNIQSKDIDLDKSNQWYSSFNDFVRCVGKETHSE